MTIGLGISIDLYNSDTPELPDAKRGDCVDYTVMETRAQLDNGFLWWTCGFCGRKVFIDTKRNYREKCDCGAVRVNRQNEIGWRKNGEESWFI